MELRGISFSQDGRTVLDGIDLSLTQPRIGIIGRNGSGKSSLLRIMAGLQRPDAGDVRVFGVDVLQDRAAAVRILGVVFQNPDHQIIFPTVEEEIAFGLTQLGQSRAAARDRARACLDQHGLAHWAERPTHALSQGQRQYLCLLSVLAMEPEVILLDEPFAALDLLTRTQLFRSLFDLAPRLVMVTHDTSNLAGFDRVLWLDQGRVRADGAPASVIEEFQSEMMRLAQDRICWR
jgi:biotin transport system ATP-binding protein